MYVLLSALFRPSSADCTHCGVGVDDCSVMAFDRAAEAGMLASDYWWGSKAGRSVELLQALSKHPLHIATQKHAKRAKTSLSKA